MPEALPPRGAQGQTPAVPRAVFITGASGFIGRALMARYAALGCRVAGIDMVADPARNVVAGDITQPQAWAAQARDCDLFIHTAAVVSLSAIPLRFSQISVTPYWRLGKAVHCKNSRNTSPTKPNFLSEVLRELASSHWSMKRPDIRKIAPRMRWRRFLRRS